MRTKNFKKGLKMKIREVYTDSHDKDHRTKNACIIAELEIKGLPSGAIIKYRQDIINLLSEYEVENG